MASLRIAFAGTPDFAVPALQALAASSHQLVAVITRPDRPQGRGQRIAASPVKQAAAALGKPVMQPTSLKDPAVQDALAALNADVLVVVAYGQILPQRVLDIPRLGCVNIHASLLPRWRGAAPIQRAILAGDTRTGVTIMRMDAGLDTGPILLQRELTISSDETGGTLHDKLAKLGAEALMEAIDGIAAGTLHERPQPEEGVTYAAKIEKSEARIDWNQSALDIERKVRAFSPWPIAETRFQGEQLRILRARAVAESTGQAPGSIAGLRDDAIVVSCGSGALEVLQVQRPGRKPISARDFCNAVPLSGQRFE